MADYNTIYTARRKGNELFGGFIEGLVRNMSEQGWLRLANLYIAGKLLPLRYPRPKSKGTKNLHP
ncbi:MAG: hypothetical protein KAJ95_07595, partial [Gammaproteobacteria bacterium]|nr:hypothetical protein [Gammaproteobacteria bacterium]